MKSLSKKFWTKWHKLPPNCLLITVAIWPLYLIIQFSSVQFSHSVVSDSLQPHEFQHARPPCPSPTPGVHSNSCPSSRWCHPAISSSVVHFPSCPQFLLASESFPMSQLFAWRGQSTGVSALASVLPMKNQDWFPLGWTHWISLHHGISNFLAALVHVLYPRSICNFKNLSLCSWSWNNARVRSCKP